MKKTLLLATILLSVIILSSNSFAAIHLITEWSGEQAQTDSAGFFINNHDTNQYWSEQNDSRRNSDFCTDACPGYYNDTTSCLDGMELQSCPEENCSSYKRCRGMPCQAGYDTSLKDCAIDVQSDNYLCTKCSE